MEYNPIYKQDAWVTVLPYFKASKKATNKQKNGPWCSFVLTPCSGQESSKHPRQIAIQPLLEKKTSSDGALSLLFFRLTKAVPLIIFTGFNLQAPCHLC